MILLFFILMFSSVEAESLRVRFIDGKKTIRLSGYNIRFNGAVGRPGFNLNRYEITQNLVQRQQVWRIYDAETKKTQEFKWRKLRVEGDFVRVNWRQVANRLDLLPEPSQKISVVGYMKMEQYLKVVLPSEMPANWPLEAIKAQAIASRTYAYLKKKQRSRYDYDLESSVNDQVFDLKKSSSMKVQERTMVLRALRETRGKMLVDKFGRVFRAYYHSDCGGETEEPHNVWGGHKKMGTVKDHQCPAGPHSNWVRRLSFFEIAGKLKLKMGWPQKSQVLESLKVVKRTASGRVLKVRFNFSSGGPRFLSGQSLREVLGYSFLKSTKFQMIQKQGKVQFIGSGFGHGVGMCQWGGRRLASQGWSYQQILKRYYPKSKLKKIL